MSLDPRSLDGSVRYTIDGFDLPTPWRCLYADRSEAVFETVRIRLLVSLIDLTEIEPGRLRLNHQPTPSPLRHTITPERRPGPPHDTDATSGSS